MNFSVLKRPSIFMASQFRRRDSSPPGEETEELAGRRESIFDLLFLLRRNSARTADPLKKPTPVDPLAQLDNDAEPVVTSA